MPDDLNMERVALLRAYGARVSLMHPLEFMQGVINNAEEILAELTSLLYVATIPKCWTCERKVVAIQTVLNLIRSNSFFIQDQTRMAGDRLQLSAAARTQGFALTQPVFQGAPSRYQGVSLTNPPRAYTGDVSIAWFFQSSGTKLRAHGGNTYRAPSAFERFDSGYSTGSFTPYGDPQMRPERAIALDGGIDQSLLKNRVRLGATYFYTKLQEVIQFVRLPAMDPYQRIAGGYSNIGGGLARGVELNAEVSPTRSLTIAGAYTYTNAILKTTTRPGLLIISGTSKV